MSDCPQSVPMAARMFLPLLLCVSLPWALGYRNCSMRRQHSLQHGSVDYITLTNYGDPENCKNACKDDPDCRNYVHNKEHAWNTTCQLYKEGEGCLQENYNDKFTAGLCADGGNVYEAQANCVIPEEKK